MVVLNNEKKSHHSAYPQLNVERGYGEEALGPVCRQTSGTLSHLELQTQLGWPL